MEARIVTIPSGTVTSPWGFLSGATYAGIKKPGKDALDLAVLLSETPCTSAGVFTTNRIKAAPVILTQDRLESGKARAIVVNSGCANASTGEAGLKDASEMTEVAAAALGIDAGDVLVCSTGVIGKRLPMKSINEGIKQVALSPDGGHMLARAIMTTDTVQKEIALSAAIGGTNFVVGGVAKGAGMIHPDMATLLCFLATDAAVETGFLRSALKKAVDISFNMVSIDGDTSTNDTVLVLANGMAGNKPIAADGPERDVFQQALNQACIYLAKSVARDGEGATRLIEVTVGDALNTEDARLAARTIVSSPLVKSAIHGNDPNWGRILAAAGRSGAELVESRLDLYIGDTCLVKEGQPLSFDTEKVSGMLGDKEVKIHLLLNLGEATATAWGCDLSEEYVTINSQYTT
jgi:glutamate N-acetyltransferase/amino-acid N-acetyltransferase